MNDMYENIWAAAAVNNKRISEQNLTLIQLKYGVDDMEECLRFCTEQRIEVYNEADRSYWINGMYENIRMVASFNNNRISEQNLALVLQDYGLDNMEECLRFCTEQKIEIYNEDEEGGKDWGNDIYEMIRRAAVSDNNRISEQDLIFYMEEYGIDDMEECLRYCTEQGIEVYKETDNTETQEHLKEDASKSQIVSEKRFQRNSDLSSEITERAWHLAEHLSTLILRKEGYEEANCGIMYACGTVVNRIIERFCRLVRHTFTTFEMEFIVAHLEEEDDDDIIFKMTDDFNQEICDRLNRMLNAIIQSMLQDIVRMRKSYIARRRFLYGSSIGNSEECG